MTSRTARWITAHRWLALSALSVALGLGLVVVGASSTGTPPADAGFLGLCDADETLPAPTSPYGTLDGITYSTSSRSGYSVVSPTDAQNTSMAQYAGAGLSWNTFGMSCMDAVPQMQTMAANWVFTILTVFPLRVLGVMLQLAFSTTIADLLINAAQPVVTGLATNVFTRWLPLAVFAVLVAAAARLAAQRGRQAWTPVASLLLVTGLMGTLVVNGTGLSLLRSLNDVTRDVTNCVMFGAAGVGCATNTVDPTAMFTDGMVETLASSSWGAGAVGDLAQTTAPTTLHITAHHGTPSFTTDQDVAVPVEAIPARVPGAPTYAEVVRWTQTYTNAEMAAMAADPSKQCLASPDQSPKIGVVSDPSNADVNRGQLCSYKWLVRTAVLSDLYTAHPAQYTTLRGAGSESIIGAISGIGMLPLALGIGVMGFLVLLYQLKFVYLGVGAPVVALFNSVGTARRWLEEMGATLIKRVAVGLVLGLVLWATSAINTGLITAISTPFATVSIPVQFVPVVTSLAVLALMVAGWMMLSSLRDILLSGVHLPEGDSTTDRLKRGAMKAAEIGVGAGAGALAAGSGARFAGAWRGLSRSNAFGGGIGRAYRSGDFAGQSIESGRRRALEKSERAAERQAAEEAKAAANQEKVRSDSTRVSRGLDDVLRDLYESPEASAARQDIFDTTVSSLTQARDLAKERRDGLSFDPGEQEKVRSRILELLGAGMTRDAATHLANREHDERWNGLDRILTAAETMLADYKAAGPSSVPVMEDDLVTQVTAALQQPNADPEVIATQLDASRATRRAIRRYADTLAEASRLRYYGVHLPTDEAFAPEERGL